jgi:nucleoid DNA-binding protein
LVRRFWLVQVANRRAPRTGEAIKVKAGKTVRFKAAPNLKAAV